MELVDMRGLKPRPFRVLVQVQVWILYMLYPAFYKFITTIVFCTYVLSAFTSTGLIYVPDFEYFTQSGEFYQLMCTVHVTGTASQLVSQISHLLFFYLIL